jgi:hypothetical protein
MVADPNPLKRFPKKRLIFTCRKISALALHTGSLELCFAPLVKSQKFDFKINFFLEKFYKREKFWVLK